MEERGRRRLLAVAVGGLATTYFLAFARPLPLEPRAEPLWVAALPPAGQGLQGGLAAPPDKPFRLGPDAGYFSDEGAVRVLPRASGLAISPDAYVAYEARPESLSVRSPSGAEIGVSTEAGYPFFSAGRLFVVGPGQYSLLELDQSGARRWLREFPSVLTAFAASEEVALAGTLDGRLLALDRSGAPLLDEAPGGSRIEAIYACAVSPDGRSLAAIAGLEPQRLLVYERRASGYRVAHHRTLSDAKRGPAPLEFAAGGRYLVFEEGGDARLLDMEGFREAGLRGSSFRSLAGYDGGRGWLALLTKDRGSSLVFARPDGARVLSLVLPPGMSFAALDEEGLTLGSTDRGQPVLMRLALKEL